VGVGQVGDRFAVIAAADGGAKRMSRAPAQSTVLPRRDTPFRATRWASTPLSVSR
jgi:hypothetical protein